MGAATYSGWAENPLIAFLAVRKRTEELVAPLSREDQTAQSMPDASPSKWHLAHTTWFFETFVLRAHLSDYVPFNPDYESLFNSYYNSVGEQLPRSSRGIMSRPGVDEILGYRQYVDEKLAPLLESPSREVLRLVELGRHHEQQHQELILTDIKHLLAQNPLDPIYRVWHHKPATVQNTYGMRFIGIAGGQYEVGYSETGFCFDNELPRHRVLLADFEIAERPINNGEVISFIENGGYDEPLLWLSDGWAHKKSNQLELPFYWRKEGSHDYSQFTLHGRAAVDPAAPACHLSYFEADAIARFLGGRLPTEQEWEIAAQRHGGLQPTIDLNQLHPSAPFSENEAACAMHGALGGVWEWTQSPYVAYPGYRPAPGAIGEYNSKFMHNQMVLRGGSCVTPSNHARISYRNFFPSCAQWQFSGARLARGTSHP